MSSLPERMRGMLIPVESGSNCVGCVNDVGDEDCAKCLIRGILLNGCPYKCEDYEDIFGNKPNRRERDDGAIL